MPLRFIKLTDAQKSDDHEGRTLEKVLQPSDNILVLFFSDRTYSLLGAIAEEVEDEEPYASINVVRQPAMISIGPEEVRHYASLVGIPFDAPEDRIP